MSRSRRKTPIRGIGSADSEKLSKRWWNRYFRHRTRLLMKRDQEHEALPKNIKKETELWDGPKDGKMRFEPEKYPHLMRK